GAAPADGRSLPVPARHRRQASAEQHQYRGLGERAGRSFGAHAQFSGYAGSQRRTQRGETDVGLQPGAKSELNKSDNFLPREICRKMSRILNFLKKGYMLGSGGMGESPVLSGALVAWQGLFSTEELDAIVRLGDGLAMENAELSGGGAG